ncbi:SMC-Scp complex subunit ScpB [Stecheria sp. CLA-KB-P133]|uniref:Segregation and condensation protein B n=1 Tax=Grylomicrobium aquisgranensis TaxID=2926318 RepID=A0AB35U4G8_9FIRM|nr:SMC-Scp complex subunit ScpB [Stecheria sp. CLA-KB-P133]
MSEQLAEQQNETDLQAAAELNQRQLAVLEGLLFVTGDEGLTAAQAADTLGVSEKQAEELFAQLQKVWQSDDRGLEVVRYGDIYRFLTKAFVHTYAARLFSKDVKTQLSQAALETLAIIAYKQPVTRVEIEEIRGVSADAMLRKLIARGLVKEDGRSEAPGRPILYSVTNEFMDAFQLLSLDELPDLPAFNQDEKKNDDLFTQ